MNDLFFIFESDFLKYRDCFKAICSIPMKVEKGTDLCVQCMTSGWMYYILEGMTKTYIRNSDGTEQILDFMMQDTIVGMDCIVPNVRSVVTINCVTDCVVLPFNNEMLEKLLYENKELSYDMVLYFGKVLRQVAYTTGMLSIANPTARFANFLTLFRTSDYYNRKQRIDLTQDEVASAINLSRSQMAKLYSQFRKEGLIENGNGWLKIKDHDKIRHLSMI